MKIAYTLILLAGVLFTLLQIPSVESSTTQPPNAGTDVGTTKTPGKPTNTTKNNGNGNTEPSSTVQPENTADDTNKKDEPTNPPQNIGNGNTGNASVTETGATSTQVVSSIIAKSTKPCQTKANECFKGKTVEDMAGGCSLVKMTSTEQCLTQKTEGSTNVCSKDEYDQIRKTACNYCPKIGASIFIILLLTCVTKVFGLQN